MRILKKSHNRQLTGAVRLSGLLYVVKDNDMELFRIFLITLLAVQAILSLYKWYKAEDDSVEEIGYMVRSFGFVILMAVI